MHGPTSIVWANLTPFSLQQCRVALLQALLARRGGTRPTATDPTTAPGQARTQGEGEWGGGRAGWAVRVKRPAYAEVAAPHRPFDFIDSPRALEGALDSQIAAVREAMATLGGAADTKKRRVLL